MGIYDDFSQELLYSVFATEPSKGVEDWLCRVAATVGEIDCSAGCIASPGPLDVSAGCIVNVATMGWKNVPIVDLLQKKFNCKFYLINDCNAGALGVLRRQCSDKSANIAYLSVSTGIGGGIIVDGKLYVGNGNAAEFGHVHIDGDGIPCGCGRTDCLELYASGSGIERLYFRQTKTSLSCREIAARAENGDAVATRLLSDAGQKLNAFVKNLNTVMDFDAVYVGGSVANCQLVFEEMKKSVNIFRVLPDGKQVIYGALEYLLDCELK